MDNQANVNVTIQEPPKAARRFANGDEILGRYVVQAELGQGGMGVVYKCFDKIGGVEVAVKGLPPEVSHNSDEMEAVRENFQLVSELHHPNIAGVRTLEKDSATGDYYLVMTLARGISLRHWLRQHGGKEHRAEQLNVLRQIASALDYAHNAEPKHIIHRDVKPENIMVDDGGHVMVLDFGLAAQVRSSLSRVSQIVTSRSGTPAYKSPEQWLAQAQRAPSDQYSLGVIAYQMFAGELPFDSDDLDILKHAVVFDPVPAISDEGKAINAAIAKSLAKKPQERFASCAAFVAALEGRDAAGGGSPARRSRIGLVAAGIAVLAVIVGGVWMLQRPQVQSKTGRAHTVVPVERPVPTMVVEKVMPAVPARTDGDADRRRQEEVAKLATTRTKINIKVAAAKDDYAKVAPYRSEKEGFESHLAEIDRQWETVEGVQTPKTLAEAEKTLAAVTEATDAIAFELNWLATNRDGRDAAKRIEKEIAGDLEVKLREFKADDVAKSKYDKGQGERKAAAQALGRGEFVSARRQYETAKATLAEALAEARQFHIKTALAVANEYKAVAQWQKCCDELTKALAWEPENADALTLKKEAESHLGPKPGDTKTITLPGGATMEMVWCPPGSFMMGSPMSDDPRDGDEVQHRVTLTQGFWMGKYEVTQRQWESVMGENPSRFKSPARPVEHVSWEDCQRFIQKINVEGRVTVSLPTEAQWEYACRAGSTTSLPNGKTLRVLGANNGPVHDEIAWYGGNSSVGFELPDGADVSDWKEKQYSGSKAGTHPVGQKKPNDWGLYDMIGNVCEWCADWYGKDYYAGTPSNDPTGPASGSYRVYRGGSWRNNAQDCRSAFRDMCEPGYRDYCLGFRLVCSAGPRR